MAYWIHRVFDELCGQAPGHVWQTDGFTMPCCQRCTGLYAGALLACLILAWARHRQFWPAVWIPGVFILLMVPFGYHWVPQGPCLRTVSGQLFGCGVVSLLWLLPGARWLPPQPLPPGRFRRGSLLLAASLLLVPLAASVGGFWLLRLLTLASVAGVLVLAALVGLNLWLLLQAAFSLPANKSRE
jgi:uncharacterized membrane protein